MFSCLRKRKGIVMVYIGASTCGFANDPDLPGINVKAAHFKAVEPGATITVLGL